MKLFRDGPTRIGFPIGRNASSRLSRVRLCATVLPNPIPGSTQSDSGATPAASAVATAVSSPARTSPRRSSYRGSACMVRGVPRMCMTVSPAPCAAHTRASSGPAASPVTSFTMCAPSASAASATSGLEVSTDTGHGGSSRSRSSTGRRRARSSAAGTAGDPGRVDSAPTSRRSAPSAASARA